MTGRIVLIVAAIALVASLAWLLLGGKEDADGARQASGMRSAAADAASAAPAPAAQNVVKTDQAAPRQPPTVDPVPVQVGGTDEFDACGSSGKVVGLDRNGDNFLSVRAAPDRQALETDRLRPDADFYMCDGTKDEAWVGIVYEAGGKLGSGCGVSSPIAKRGNYAGTCRSGWVSRKYVQLVAG